MSTFSADWLDLREPADARARSRELAERMRASIAAPRAEPLRLLDLATGTGSHLRWLRSVLPGPQSWLAVDYDEALLKVLESRSTGAARDRENAEAGAHTDESRVTTRCLDLVARLSSLDFGGVDLVAASALLDLVSSEWLQQLAAKCVQARTVAYFSLTYDGRMSFAPAHELDEDIRAAINWHQLQDKGFGPALGPDAASRAVALFESLGYASHSGNSEWNLTDADTALQAALIDGWAAAAFETGLLSRFSIEQWRTQRLQHLQAQRSRIIVGHVDLLFVPAEA